MKSYAMYVIRTNGTTVTHIDEDLLRLVQMSQCFLGKTWVSAHIVQIPF